MRMQPLSSHGVSRARTHPCPPAAAAAGIRHRSARPPRGGGGGGGRPTSRSASQDAHRHSARPSPTWTEAPRSPSTSTARRPVLPGPRLMPLPDALRPLMLRGPVTGMGEARYRLGGDYRALARKLRSTGHPGLRAARRGRPRCRPSAWPARLTRETWPFLTGALPEISALAGDRLPVPGPTCRRAIRALRRSSSIPHAATGRIATGPLWHRRVLPLDLRLSLLEASRGADGHPARARPHDVLSLRPREPPRRPASVAGFLRLGGAVTWPGSPQ